MNDFNNKICRLCLETAPACEYRTIKEIEKEVQECLHININLNVSDYAIACKSCQERLQDCLELKYQCSTAFMNIDKKVVEKIFHGEMKSDNKICLENSQGCQLCMSLIKDEDFKGNSDLKDGVLLKDMIRNCMPELDLNIAQELFICKLCLNSIKSYYEFMRNCQEVEQRIEHFRQLAVHGTAGKVNLEDVLKFNHYNMPEQSLIIKKEYSDEEADVDLMNSLKNEEIPSIKCEEIDVKDEVDNGYMLIHEKPEVINKFKCDKCPYWTKRQNELKKHMVLHSDKHPFSCDHCAYSTKFRSYLIRHKRMHQNMQHDTSIKMDYKCKECPFSTKYKRSFLRHQLEHTNPDQVPMYKCEKCVYKTMYKRDVYRHMLVHEESEVANRFRCDKCPYRTKRQGDLKKHMVLHSDKRPFSCDHCTFSTKLKRHLVRHKRTHQNECELDDSKQAAFKCGQCKYSTGQKRSFHRHQMKHMELGETTIYYCAICYFKTKYKDSLRCHIKTCLKRIQKNDDK